MVDSLFQGFGAGVGGTHNAVLSSTEYLSTVGACAELGENLLYFFATASQLEKASGCSWSCLNGGCCPVAAPS